MTPDKDAAVGFVEYRFFRVGEVGDDLLESNPRREIKWVRRCVRCFDGLTYLYSPNCFSRRAVPIPKK